MKNMLKTASAVKSMGQQKGYTLVELSVAVAIAGVLLMGSIQLVQTVLNTSRANDTISSLARTITQIDKVWSSLDTYADLSIANASAAGAFPDMTTRGSGATATVINKFNMPVQLDLIKNLPTAGSDRGFALVHTGIPRSVCADIVTAGVAAGFKGIVIIPENTAGVQASSLTGLTMNTSGGIDNVPTTAALALDPSSPSLNIGKMTGATGCGASKNSVSIGFVTWK